MKLSHKQLKQIKEFAKAKVKKNDPLHQLHHVLRTIHISKILATKENADVLKCTVIAWLHDIEKNKEKKGLNHGKEGSKSASVFLKKIGLKKQDIKEISHAIKKHDKENGHETIESKIIWDADKLQTLGAEGLLRIHGHYMKQGLSQEESYKTTIKEQKFYFS